MKSSRRLNRRRRERYHLLVLKFYSLSSFSVFLCLSASVSVFLAVRSLLRALSLSLFLKLFLLPVVSKTPTSLRNLSEKTRAHENDRRHKVLPFIRSQTDRQEGRKELFKPLAIRQSTRTTFGTLERKEKLCTLSLSVYISIERTRHHHHEQQHHDLLLLCLLLVAKIDDQHHPALLLLARCCRCRKEALRKDV